MIKYYIRQGKHPKTSTAIYFGQNVAVEPITLADIAEEMEHSTTLTKADILACFRELEQVLIAKLRNNISVRFGLLGSFCPTMRSTSARSSVEFTKANIKNIAVAFRPSATMKYKLRADNPEMSFQLVEPNE